MAEVYDDRTESNNASTDRRRSIASAVALPDSEDVVKRPTSNGMKRRQSDVADDIDGSSKRQRTSPGKTSPRSRSRSAAKEGGEVASSAAQARSTSPTESKNGSASKPETSAKKSREGGGRRKNTVVKAPDEKQRSKRLFGALLGNLNRPSDRTSKRRAEIEQRKKAELQKQDDERLEDRQRRLERLAIQRKNEQLQVDEREVGAPAASNIRRRVTDFLTRCTSGTSTC